MNLLRDGECYLSRDLLKLCRFAAEIESETSADVFVERVVSDYLAATYGLQNLEAALRRANAKRREVLEAERELLKPKPQEKPNE